MEQYFVGCAENTGNDATVFIPIDVTIIDGLALEAGDEIAIYNSGNNLCAGVGIWDGSILAIAAWGDNSITPEVDGLEAGEEMRYRIWDYSEGVEYPNVTATYTVGDGLYAADSWHVVGVLDLNLPDVQEITLNQGWNLISSYIDPATPNMVDVFSQIVSDVVIVKNGLGRVYMPTLGINQIGNWNVLEGYKVYMTAPHTLTISGTQVVPESTPIDLAAGWRMVSYLRDSPLDIETALSSLGSSLFLAKNGSGRIYSPILGIDQIHNMLPGQGYQLYLTAPGTLTYPAN